MATTFKPLFVLKTTKSSTRVDADGDATSLGLLPRCDEVTLKISKSFSLGGNLVLNRKPLAKTLLEADAKKSHNMSKYKSRGKFGKYGGSFVPETLVTSLNKLEAEFNLAINDTKFQVKPVNGNFKDASSEAMRSWVDSLDTTYLLTGTAVGPHPCPTMVRHFQSVIGKERRKQANEKWGGKPDVLVACVGSGSNALGMFHEFVGDEDMRLIGVEPEHSATLVKGEVGVYHGAMCYLLQDEEGQIVRPHSVAVGLEYPGVSPELSFLKDSGRAEFYTVSDQEAINAYTRLCRLQGICPTLRNGTRVVINCSGGGDKDVFIVHKYST